MQEFIRGQKSKLDALTPLLQFEIGVSVTTFLSVDISLFGVDSHQKLSDDRYFIFFNQPQSPEGALKALGKTLRERERFSVDLTRLPSKIERLVVVLTVDGQGSVNAIEQGEIYLSANHQHVMSFPFKGSDFEQERALILLELYNKNGWRISATGQGFAGGLSALVKHFGGEEINSPAATPTQLPTSTPVRLTKVTLNKTGDQQRVSLEKTNKAPIHINLNWDQKPQGFFAQKSSDLDLGCMFIMEDGARGVIQALGGNFGARDKYPHIMLDKDDRSGRTSDGENLYIYRPELIDRVMVFTFIYEGARGFTDVNGRLTIKDQHQNEILVKLDNPNYNRTFCAICTIEKLNHEIVITKQEKYFTGHPDADHHFRFGFSWSRGNK